MTHEPTPVLTARSNTATGQVEYVLTVGDTLVGVTTCPDEAAQQLAAAVFRTLTASEQLRVMDVLRLTGCTLGQAVAAVTMNTRPTETG
ncbi:MAG: hypothetical protein MUD01_12355 [Chloroflexaceae bacterium]|jgi:hypothetical protein|nr:hypothetical protein [Chloroflexaceae bacterium]